MENLKITRTQALGMLVQAGWEEAAEQFLEDLFGSYQEIRLITLLDMFIHLKLYGTLTTE